MTSDERIANAELQKAQCILNAAKLLMGSDRSLTQLHAAMSHIQDAIEWHLEMATRIVVKVESQA